MKTLKNFFKTTLLVTSLFCYQVASAQSDVSDFIVSSPGDIKLLTQAYLEPIFKGLGSGMNSGWNYTAKAKNFGKFDIRLAATGAFVSSSDLTYDVSKLGLSNTIRLANNENPIAPTVSGSKSGGPLMEVWHQNQRVSSFNLPSGEKFKPVPTPQIQATVGLPKGIEVTLRGVPTIDLQDAGKVGMIGGGLKVEILPWIVGKKADKLLPFDLAAAIGFTQFSYELPLDVPPADNSQDADYSNQKIKARLSGINTELILSKKLAMFTPFASIGYQSSKTKADLKGNYRLISGATILGPTYTTLTDPVSIDQTDISGMRANVGFNLNLAFFRLFAAYSLAEYNTLNAGIGFGIGK